MKKTIENRVLTFGFLVLICVFLLGMGGCKKSEIPLAILNIDNECGLEVDIFLGGEFQFSIEYESTRSIEDLEDGTHYFEALRTGTGEFVAGEAIYVRINAIYTWSVLSSASIKIINNYGETLSIYGDELFVGDILDQDDGTIDNIPYGDRNLEAKTSDDTVVATTTISVLFDNTYEWTINK